MKPQLWDDAAFQKRVREAAARRGMTVLQALKAAGVSPWYLKKTNAGRGTNTVLKLAQVLDMPPAEMFGLTTLAAEPLAIDGDQLKRITIAARMMAAQLAALVYCASNGAKVDPVVLMETVLREIGKNSGI